MGLYRADELAVRGMPELDLTIVRSGSDDAAVGTERERADIVLVPLEGAQLAVGESAPQLHQMITAAGGNHAAVRTECDSPDMVPVPAQHELDLIARIAIAVRLNTVSIPDTAGIAVVRSGEHAAAWAHAKRG